MIERYLLDTNVVSELTRLSPSPSVLAFFRINPVERFYISDVTLAEIRFGLSLMENASRRDWMLVRVEDQIRPLFKTRVVSANEEAWLIWKRLERQGRKTGFTFPQPDLMIAALAIQHDLIVATRDVVPFERAGVSFFNPWTIPAE